MGRGATEEKVKAEIHTNVRTCGGQDMAKTNCANTSIVEAVDTARAFFSQHRILVMIDSVWETPVQFLASWPETLCQIASCHGSVVIATTRLRSLSKMKV